MKIHLYNRDGATLWLEKLSNIENHISEWKLNADKESQYCLEYMRVIGNYPDNITAIDPSGGPFLAVGDYLDYFPKKYKIVKINQNLTLWLSEGNNNN